MDGRLSREQGIRDGSPVFAVTSQRHSQSIRELDAKHTVGCLEYEDLSVVLVRFSRTLDCRQSAAHLLPSSAFSVARFSIGASPHGNAWTQIPNMSPLPPPQEIAGYQTWSDLLFLHWRIPAGHLQALLPTGLTIETFDGSAWLAVVPFSMERVRPWWSPPIPGISWFLETNVRTYVRHSNGQSGVWFFSLDANHRLAVAVARKFWHLNYQFATMDLRRDAAQITYSSKRPELPHGQVDAVIEVDISESPVLAVDGSLEYFLLERHHLFAQRPNGQFLCGQVHHAPYTCQSVELKRLSQTLTDAAGASVFDRQQPDHAIFSPGVNVQVSALQLIDG